MITLQKTDRKQLVKATILAFWPVPLNAAAFLMAPGFLLPFFNHPVAQKVFLALVIWMLIGFLVILRLKNNWFCGLAAVIFPVPMLLSPMLGPAFVTIITYLQGCVKS